MPLMNMFQSTRPAWGATVPIEKGPHGALVSIHAPRVGRDLLTVINLFCGFCFNPRAPRGARLLLTVAQERREEFQSTRPAWGATRTKADARRP